MKKKHLQVGVAVMAAYWGVLTAPANASALLIYSVTGTFTDGGTFSGSFGYDPVTNAYFDIPLGDQFSITTTTGSEGQGNVYTPFQSPLYYSDESSTAKDLYIFGGTGTSESTLTLDWNTALNAPDGGNLQTITGGLEIYSIATLGCGGYCVTYPDDRQIAMGYVELQSPVAVGEPAALVLLGIGLVALGLPRRSLSC